jgi:DUF4097 and DUF4098 domain-containing protein YvlB
MTITARTLLGLALAVAAAAATNAQTPAAERRAFTVGRGATLDLSNVAGDVQVTGGPGDAIVVEAIRRPRGDDRRGTATTRVEMQQTGSRVEVRTRGSGPGRSRDAVDFTASVPRETVVVARSVSGRVTVAGVDGELRLESVSGQVEATRTPNLAVAKSVSGDVTVRDSAGGGAPTLSSVSGTVAVAGWRGRGLDASTVSGQLRLVDVAAQRVLAKSVSGDLEFGGALAAGGRYEFTAHSGDVRVRLPAGAGFDLQADTYSGPLTTDFPVALRSSRHGRGSTRALRTVAGDGAAQLIVRSFSGSVTITRQ